MLVAKKVTLLMLCIVLCIVPLIGCWDRMEIEERNLVAVIGIDKGTDKNLEITYQIANPHVVLPGGNGGAADKPSEIMTFLAPDFITGRDIANTIMSREIFLNHTDVIVVSEELARSEDFIRYIGSAIRERELRRDVTVIVSREKASEFIRNNEDKVEQMTHRYYRNMMERWRETGLVPPGDIQSYFQRTSEDAGLFLAPYGTVLQWEVDDEIKEDQYKAGEFWRIGGNPAQILGSAVFKEGKMIGTLTGEETRIALLLRPDVKGGPMAMSFTDPLDEEYRISTKVYKHKRPSIKMDLKGDTPEIHATIPVTFEILAIPSYIGYVEDEEKKQILNDSFKRELEEKSMELVKKTQEEFKGEPFQWSLVARRKFFTKEAFDNYNWKEKYPTANVIVEYDVRITEFGMQLDPLNIERIGIE